MANRIKGISVEIGGDTKPLQESLKAVNKTSQELQGELKDVTRLLRPILFSLVTFVTFNSLVTVSARSLQAGSTQ